MTISEMIKFFDQLSAQEQDNLLEILRQRRSQLTEGENLADDSQSKEAISFSTAIEEQLKAGRVFMKQYRETFKTLG